MPDSARNAALTPVNRPSTAKPAKPTSPVEPACRTIAVKGKGDEPARCGARAVDRLGDGSYRHRGQGKHAKVNHVDDGQWIGDIGQQQTAGERAETETDDRRHRRDQAGEPALAGRDRRWNPWPITEISRVRCCIG